MLLYGINVSVYSHLIKVSSTAPILSFKDVVSFPKTNKDPITLQFLGEKKTMQLSAAENYISTNNRKVNIYMFYTMVL
jgi:hypothetical protein